MTRKEYDFWHCGHITRIDNGETVSENGDLSLISLVDRDTIRKRFGDACPRCYTDRVLHRLQGIRLLLFDCGSQHESVKMSERRVMALTEYLTRVSATEVLGEGSLVNYPPEFGTMMRHVVDLGVEVHTAAIDDFVAAHRRLRSRVSERFVERVNAVRDNAQLYFMMGDTRVVRECMANIVGETGDMVRELGEYEREELGLLAGLDGKAKALKGLLDGFLKGNGSEHPKL
ncbi:hypothetical protein F4679DRAFT_420775 [Xylaria curta]|nr:hypothetical protein F4679DRAFT_420775 [Xylaria curta]